jgi:tetratricopeptide (TPR) repeat protein
VQNGYPAWLARVEQKHAALPPIPTAEEVEDMAMRGAVDELRAIYRRAKANDSTAAIFTATSLNLFAFRFTQRGDRTTAIALYELAWEAFPRSTAAANNLGNAYRDGGHTSRAIEMFERALTLIGADADIAAADKAPSRTNLEQKIRQLRGPEAMSVRPSFDAV